MVIGILGDSILAAVEEVYLCGGESSEMDECGNGGRDLCMLRAILEWRMCGGDGNVYGGEMGRVACGMNVE